MYTSKDDYFYFRPRSECPGNILPVRVEDSDADEEDLSATVRVLSCEDILYFYELAITKIGLFRWAEDGFRSSAGIRGERSFYVPDGLGFPSPDPEYGLDLGDAGAFPPYVPPLRIVLPEGPTQDDRAPGGLTDPLVDPFGGAFGSRGLSEGLVGMLALLRDVALCASYPPYSGSSCRRFAWDDVVFDFAPEAESWDEPPEGYDSEEDPLLLAARHRPPIPARPVPDTETALLWASARESWTEEGCAEWFCDALETGRWARARSEESGLSLLEELRALPYRQGLVKRAWLDLLYFDSVAVCVVPKTACRSSYYLEDYQSDGAFSWPEVRVSTTDREGGFHKTFELVGDFGYEPGEAEPAVSANSGGSAAADVVWSYDERWAASRTYVACCAATSWDHVVGMNGAIPAPSLDVNDCQGDVYAGMDGEEYSVSVQSQFPLGSTGSSFEVRLPAFPSDRLPFDPDLVAEVRGYLTCSWRGSSSRTAGGARDGQRPLELPADPLTGEQSETLEYGVGRPDYLSWGCGWFSAPASVELDLGDPSAPVLRVASPAVSSAISAAESAGRCSIPLSGSASRPAYDPLDLVPVPADGYGRAEPEVVATFAGESFDGAVSLATEYNKCFGATVGAAERSFAYLGDPNDSGVLSASYRTGREIECSGYGSTNGVFPDPSSGWTTGDEFGVTEYVLGEGTVRCSGTTPYPGYNCILQSGGAASARAASSVSARVAVNCLWLFVRFRPVCAAEIALDALRGWVDSEDVR